MLASLMPAASAANRRMPGFTVLLAAMFGELMIGPFFGRAAGDLGLARVTTAIMLVGALAVVGIGRAVLLLFIPALIAQVLAGYSTSSLVAVVAATSRLVFLCYVTSVVIWHVTRGAKVTSDTIAGAACAYMLFGMVWASLYQLIEHLRPGSFEMPSTWMALDGDPQAALTYFSFVTLASLGYGDIKPTDPGVGGLCVAEALVGQLYLATMIARLVGFHIAQRDT